MSEEEVEAEDTEGGDLRLSSQQDPPRCDDPPVSSSDVLEDPLSMSFPDPAVSAGIIVEASSISTACGGATVATTS